MSSIRAERLAFSFTDAVPLLREVTFHLAEGFTGLVGENGAGKSTLLRLVEGALAPTSGAVRVLPAGALVVRCAQDVEVAGDDVRALAARRDRDARRLGGLLRLERGELARWRTLSPGERRRWQLGAALARDPDVLLLDEPTNHLDAEARALLLGALGEFRGVGLVVSHDRALLDGLTSATLRLAGGSARLYPAPYRLARAAWEAETSTAWDARGAAQEAARRASRRLDLARREQARADAERSCGRRAKGRADHDARTLGARTVVAWAEDRLGRRAEVLRREAERAAEAIPDAPAAKDLGRSVFLAFEPSPRPWVLTLDEERIEAGGRPLLRDVKLRLGRGDRVRLAGPNGAGKTTLLEALVRTAALPPERILCLPQELEPGAGAAALDEVRALAPQVRGRVLSLVAALGVDPARLLASRSPSPGEARKLVLALGLGRHAWAVILDEPTNHLDLPSVERLEAALTAYPGAILLVSHDEAFAARCASVTWRIEDGRVETVGASG